MIPRRSSSTVHTETLNGDELCLYGWRTKEVHALNATAACVGRMCDGRTTVRDMAEKLRAEFDVRHAEELVRLALAEIKKQG